VIILCAGFSKANPANLTPFIPFGVSGIFQHRLCSSASLALTVCRHWLRRCGMLCAVPVTNTRYLLSSACMLLVHALHVSALES
jgi:hypothetical protein